MKINRLLAFAVLLLATLMPLTMAKASTDKTLACPVCHMPMTQKKEGMMTVPLLVHGKKWYCCPMCGAGKQAAMYEKTHHGKLFVAEK